MISDVTIRPVAGISFLICQRLSVNCHELVFSVAAPIFDFRLIFSADPRTATADFEVWKAASIAGPLCLSGSFLWSACVSQGGLVASLDASENI